MKSFAKAAAAALLPAPWLITIRAVRARRHSQRLLVNWKVRELSERIWKQFGPSVAAGPFEGMALSRENVKEQIGPYLFGSLEHQLHGIVNSLRSDDFSSVLNIGCKTGYYAVGLARRLRLPVTAFDVDPWARRVTRETAALNGVSNLLTTAGLCTRKTLSTIPARTLIVSDCEGYEFELFKPEMPGPLRTATLIVEVHRVAGHREDPVGTLTQWFSATHLVKHIADGGALPLAPVNLDAFSVYERELCQSELRGDQVGNETVELHLGWIYCTPLDRAA